MSDLESHLEKLLKAVHRKCRECCGGSVKEVEECGIDKCALWPWRNASPTVAGKEEVTPEPLPEEKALKKISSTGSQHTLF